MSEEVLNVLGFKMGIRGRMEKMMVGKHTGREPPWVTSIVESKELPVNEKSLDRLYDEAVALSGAGETTAQGIMTVAMFHLLQQPETWRKLKDEVLTVFPDVTKPPSLAELETLPLLTSTITEGTFSIHIYGKKISD